MSPGLLYLPVLKHAYHVGVDNRRKAMGYDYRCAVLHQFLKGILNKALTFSVKCRCSLVKNKDGGIFEYGAGNADTCLLYTSDAADE